MKVPLGCHVFFYVRSGSTVVSPLREEFMISRILTQKQESSYAAVLEGFAVVHLHHIYFVQRPHI
jgi:hypothetical protein